jgi:hypothetical protein
VLGRATADEIKEDILEHGLKDGVLLQHYATGALDASTLLAALFGFLPRDDERLRKSVLAIADDLTEDGFVLRYRTGETDDGLSGKEGSFMIAPRPLRRGIRHEHRSPPGEFSAGVFTPRADPTRGGHHPGRAVGGDRRVSDAGA